MKIQVGPVLKVPITNTNEWFIKTTKSPDLEGEVKRRFFPSPRIDSLISRVRNGLLFTNYFYSSGVGGDMIVSCGDGRRLILIEVNSNDPICCFSFQHLIGYTSNIIIESHMNLSLAASIADRIFTHAARCMSISQQGYLLMETRGQPVMLHNEHQTFDIRRMIAWDPRVEFWFEELVGMVDVVMTPAQVHARQNRLDDAVLLSADDSESEKFVSRIIRQLISIVIPTF